ncbi:MAG: hypothetical protein OXG11_05440 [Chloroflexi bacterium]|nr:hypothetical protein [Chloroflexota bacterium]
MAVELENRWMPPSPHRERIVEELETGRLTLRERGHGLPPVVVHEDGGHIDLPDIRWNGTRWKLADKPSARGRQTAYSDVCGCSFEVVDILKDAEALSEREVARIRELERDVDYMVGRMDGRLQKYSDFAASLESIAKKIGEIARPDPRDVRECFDEAAKLLVAGPIDSGSNDALADLTERARLVAQAQEDTMKEKKVLAIQALLAFEALRGARNWDEEIEEVRSTNGA